MVENHTFDNLFGSFPGADGIPANASFLNPNAYYDSAPNVSPVQATPNEGDVQFFTDLAAGPGVNSALTINLEAETGGLSLDPAVNGPVTLTLTPKTAP